MAERFSFEYTLFCITLVDGKGALLEGEMVQTTSEMLKNAIGESLRKGDLFTCYSPVQYLVLLNGAGQEHVLAVCERVERSLKQWENGKKINSWDEAIFFFIRRKWIENSIRSFRAAAQTDLVSSHNSRIKDRCVMAGKY